LVHDKNIEQVIPLYKEALEHLKKQAQPKKRLGLIYSWVSDTFIIYSRDDTEKEFAHVEQVARLFFQNLILHRIPVRGALTHGSLYSQSAENIFVGPALIDAYNYGEKQQWVGFILTPSVFKRLESSSVALAARAHYRLVDESGIINHEPSTPVHAFAFNNGTVQGKNPYLSALQQMKTNAPPHAKEKYERTISFIHKHHRSADEGLPNNALQATCEDASAWTQTLGIKMSESPYREVWVEVPDGQFMCVLINGEQGWLMYLRENGDAGFSSRNPTHTGAAEATIKYRLDNGHFDEYPASWAYPVKVIARPTVLYREPCATAIHPLSQRHRRWCHLGAQGCLTAGGSARALRARLAKAMRLCSLLSRYALRSTLWQQQCQ
jgi:hypothetical protein